MNALEALEKFVNDELASEGITPQLLEMVDLSIEYSPVIPFRDGQLEHAVRVHPWGFYPRDILPDKFEIDHPLVTNPVGRESLKVMRARYLLARDAHYGPIVHQMVRRAVEGSRN